MTRAPRPQGWRDARLLVKDIDRTVDFLATQPVALRDKARNATDDLKIAKAQLELFFAKLDRYYATGRLE